MSAWELTAEFVAGVPAGLWVAAPVVAILATWTTARRRLRRAGQRTANPRLAAAGAKDTALTVASIIPAVLFWLVVLAGSFHGLVAFGRDTLGWRDGWEYLVPGSLDGVSVTFALLSFRAVRKRKAPDRCYRVVWGAAAASAIVNFNYEYNASGHNLVAGGYLALLSLLGVVIFHELLHQFEEGTRQIKRENPKFGLRWITWTTNTFCAAVAWRNHPPAQGTMPTVRNAVANLERVRAMKRASAAARTSARHEHALAKARRAAELTAAKGGARRPADSVASVNGHGRCGSASGQPPSEVAVKVPGTAWRVSRWINTWRDMCADGDLALGPITNEHRARDQYGMSAKHLREVRKAATSGALRLRADELGVPIPADYIDKPARVRSTRATPAGALARLGRGHRR